MKELLRAYHIFRDWALSPASTRAPYPTEAHALNIGNLRSVPFNFTDIESDEEYFETFEPNTEDWLTSRSLAQHAQDFLDSLNRFHHDVTVDDVDEIPSPNLWTKPKVNPPSMPFYDLPRPRHRGYDNAEVVIVGCDV